jgi:hypothetical protein
MYSGVHTSSRKETRYHDVVSNVPCKTKGCMVNALVSRSDEGRDMAAISFGEVPNNL